MALIRYDSRHEWVYKLARELMAQYGLVFPHWSFRINNNVRRLGVCKRRSKFPLPYGSGQIELSQYVVESHPEQVPDTLKHELCHALVPHDRHGPAWKAMCHKVGAIPKACAAIKAPPGKWSAT